jgi:prephenate dehydrogenase
MTDSSLHQSRQTEQPSALIVGLGLLGGSLGMALRECGWFVRGLVRRPEACAEAEKLGIVDEVVCSPDQLPREDVSIVVLAVPIGALEQNLEMLRGKLPPGTIITDVSSVKGPVMRDLEALIASEGWRFVGGHPMAGAETSGMAYARADLFKSAWVALCPGKCTDSEAMDFVRAMWIQVGARCLEMDAGAHDGIVARTSHLPHLVASLMVMTGIGGDAPEFASMLAAGGFRDSTRIAAGPPGMWCEIMQCNRRELIDAIRLFSAQLSEAVDWLENGDSEELKRMLTLSADLRRNWRGSGDPDSGGPGEDQ